MTEEFKVGDIVDWNGMEGEVLEIAKFVSTKSIYVKFKAYDFFFGLCLMVNFTLK